MNSRGSLAKAGGRNPMFGRHHSTDARKKQSIAKQGPKNNFWKGGGGGAYAPGWNRILKESIKHRDGYICQFPGCGSPEGQKTHHVHHIDYNRTNHNPDNLIELCPTCHKKTTAGDREFFEAMFAEIQSLRKTSHG